MATLLFLVYSVTAGLQFVSPLGFAVPFTSEGGKCSQRDTDTALLGVGVTLQQLQVLITYI